MLRGLAKSIQALQGLLPSICEAADRHSSTADTKAAQAALGSIAKHAQPICSLAADGPLNTAARDALRRAMSCRTLALSDLERATLGTVLSLLGGGE